MSWKYQAYLPRGEVLEVIIEISYKKNIIYSLKIRILKS